MRSVLRIDTNEKFSEQYLCNCGECNGGRFDIVYSAYHAGVIGWRRQDVSEEEKEYFPEGYIMLCPECAKNTEQQVQPDNSPKMCEECGEYPADLPSNLRCGCDAYKEHLS